ncbi:TIGR03619 family F420-dependent LLM class oxidoreductase [Microlunatus sp. GCM10028923]|uniref:TIGR03619 family F420-dependent LLM class oxidoreductase n=1 Tax=Microlunatus sp. GCM10028923 TaxID=3273400 RepID=UPI00361A1247
MTAVRLGLNLPNFGLEAEPAAMLGWARFAEQEGFDLVVVSDHVAPTPEVAATYPAPFHDPFVLLGWLAGQTSTVRLGTSVVVLPYRHPLHTARMSAMLHDYSDGRFVLGVGTGWARTEFAALGLDSAVRGRATDAALDVITRAWAEPLISAHAEGLDFTDVATAPNPPGGALPLWVGGQSRAAIRRAVRYGSAWHPINPELDWLRDTGLPALVAEAAATGRDVPSLAVRIKARLQPDPAPADRPLGVGTLDQVVGDVRALAELGAADVVLDTNPDRPRERDFAAEQRDLKLILDAL